MLTSDSPAPAMLVGAVGFGLIAVCYGFARFAFGLFLPEISKDFALSSTLSGIVSAGSFLGYCLAIVASAWLTERRGPRFVAALAGLVGATGMIGIACAPSASWLAISVVLAGSSTGLVSPALAAAVGSMVQPERHDATNTAINAGTSAGVALSGPVAVMMGTDWRLAFAGFAGATLLMAWAALSTLAGPGAVPRERAPLLPPLTPGVKRLAAAAFLTGAASTVVWSFGADLVAANLGWDGKQIGMLWTVMGVAGLTGAAAGYLIARIGMRAVHLGFHLALALATVAVGIDLAPPALVFAGGALFGAAYLMLTGVYLVWGIGELPERPALGVTLAFLALAVGQTIGAMVFGVVMDLLSPNAAVLAFAALAVLAAGVRRSTP